VTAEVVRSGTGEGEEALLALPLRSVIVAAADTEAKHAARQHREATDHVRGSRESVEEGRRARESDCGSSRDEVEQY